MTTRQTNAGAIVPSGNLLADIQASSDLAWQHAQEQESAGNGIRAEWFKGRSVEPRGSAVECGCCWATPHCSASDNGSWCCTRPVGHSGDHVACTPGQHNLHRWPNAQHHVRPWIGQLHHARELCDDWGCIRDEAGTMIIRVNIPPYDESVLNEHRRNKTDPTQERVDAILAALNMPNAALTGGEAVPSNGVVGETMQEY